MNMSETQKEILGIGSKISKQLASLRSYKRKMKEIQTMADTINREITAGVLNAKEVETGKAVYTNDKMREAEIKKRLGLNSTWVEYQDYILKLEEAVGSAEDEITVLKIDAKGWHTIALGGAMFYD